MAYLTCLVFLLFQSCTHDHFKQERALKNTDVPSEVLEGFHQRHKNIQENFHLQITDGLASYEVHFVEEGKEKSERFNAKGKLIESEEKIKFEEVPEITRNKIQSFLDEEKENSILEVQKIHNKEFDGFELKMKSKKSKTGLMEYFFKLDGSLDHHEEVELIAIPSLS
jgi:hypothetical protein